MSGILEELAATLESDEPTVARLLDTTAASIAASLAAVPERDVAWPGFGTWKLEAESRRVRGEPPAVLFTAHPALLALLAGKPIPELEPGLGEVALRVATLLGIARAEALDAVEALAAALSMSIAAAPGPVEVPGLGTFTRSKLGVGVRHVASTAFRTRIR